MRNSDYTFYLILWLGMAAFSQEAVVTGRIVDSNTNEPVEGVKVVVEKSKFHDTTTPKGVFEIRSAKLPLGEQLLAISRNGYISQRMPITIRSGGIVNIDPLLLEMDLNAVETQIGIISLTDLELDQDVGTSFNTSGLLNASRDAFLNAAAFDFSATFFRPRGFDNENGKLLINGIEMNKQYTGRPQWANWGGLNDAQRNREFAMGLKSSDYTFGDVAGTTNITMRASRYRRGGRVSYATANRSYRGRVMASYNSGITGDDWAYSILLSRRFGHEGFIEGTLYDANSFFVSIEKQFSDGQSLNLTAFYTPNRRGRSTAITEEVERLKGRPYNPNWGYQDEEIRSSRIRKIEEPVIILSHYWDISNKTQLNTNLAYQFGKFSDSRLDASGNRNPAGNYYQRLPSYFLRNPNPTAYDYFLAYEAEQELINDGQLNWNSFYAANARNTDGHSVYVIQEDVIDDEQITVNTILNSRLAEHIVLNAKLNYRNLKSDNYAEIGDLLGGKGYLDVDYFGNVHDQTQSDLQNPNRIVKEGDRYKYNFQLSANVISAFGQAQFRYNTIDFFLAAALSQTSYQRTGFYQNGYFPEDNRSLGEGEQLKFSNFGIKGGITYKITGRHLLDLNAGYFTKPPTMRNSFANARQNNDLVDGLSEESIQSADVNYIYRSPLVRIRLTGYYTGLTDRTDIGFFFTQNALGNDENNAFVQEIVTGLQQRNTGLELGLEAQLLPTFKVKAAAAFGQYIHNGDPELYLSGDDFDDITTPETLEGNDLFNRGKRKVELKNYHVAGGPERAYQLGIEYRDPEFWWVGITTNYFSNAYVDISNLRRTSDFYTDLDGQPYNDYDVGVARVLLMQEELEDYFLLNVVGGKSWRWKEYFIGFFATVNNVLNEEYRTGGFEDSRRASYRQQVEEQGRENGPLFGNRYFFGFGTTYYVNVYIRF